MAIATNTQKNTLASAYAGAALYGALYATAPSGTAGAEVTGGSPAYARVSLASLWSAPVNGVVTAVATFNVPTGTTVVGTGLHTAATGGTYLDGVTITSQTFSAQGTLAVTFTATIS